MSTTIQIIVFAGFGAVIFVIGSMYFHAAKTAYRAYKKIND